MAARKSLLLALGLWLASGTAAWAWPPPVPPSGDDGGLPPIDDDGGEPGGDDGGVVGDTEGLALDPEAEKALLEETFREHIKNAERAYRDKRYLEAIREYEAAKDIFDNDAEVLRGLAHAKRQRVRKNRCPTEAIQDLLLVEVEDPMGLWLDERQHFVEWTGLCKGTFDGERLRVAEELAIEPATHPNREPMEGRPVDIRVVAASMRYAKALDAENNAQAQKERMRALDHLEQYEEERLNYKEPLQPTQEALQLRMIVHEEMSQLEQAIRAAKDLVRLYPEAPFAAEASEKASEWEIDLRVKELAKNKGGKPTEAARQAYLAGVEAGRVGNFAVAESELARAVELSPWFPEAQFQLGRVLARQEKWKGAVDALDMAARLKPSAYEYNMELGLLYYKRYRGQRDGEARKYLERAQRIRPDIYQLDFYLGDLHAREGNRKLAREHYEKFIAKCPDNLPLEQQARDALQNLEREAVEQTQLTIPPPPEELLTNLDPRLVNTINEAYIIGTEQGDWDRAERVLLKARDDFPQSPQLLNELAKVVHAQGRAGEARKYWEDSLGLDPSQWEVHERLGMTIPVASEAVQHLRVAADNGRPAARYELAERLWADYEFLEASEQLDQFLAEANEYTAMWEQAQQRREQWDDTFLQFYLATGLLTFLLLAFPVSRIYRRYRGSSLTQLLEREPKSFPEVARILSLIRHEILKHNTAFLSDVGTAIEMGEPDADARILLLGRRLFGDTGRDPDLERLRGDERRGIYGRFLGYCEELQKVARSNGMTLNLYRKDPTFSQMLHAFEDVADRSKWLRNPSGLRRGQRTELSKVLLRSGHVLGRKAFERLSGIIQELCIVDAQDGLISEVYERVAQEDQFSGIQLGPLNVSGEGARIRIFRTDLEDILANVFRNSLRSSVQYAEPPVSLGIDLEAEMDEITGLTSLAIRVKDRSPERLTNEMLRGRYVERGMGITADLLSKYDASIAVEPEPGWEKAVVLRFFTVEDSA